MFARLFYFDSLCINYLHRVIQLSSVLYTLCKDVMLIDINQDFSSKISLYIAIIDFNCS